MNNLAVKKEPKYCEVCGFELVEIQPDIFVCTTPECSGGSDPDQMPIVNENEQAARNIREYLTYGKEIENQEKMRQAELDVVNSHYDGVIYGLKRQQDFWARPLNQCLRSRVNADPECRKSIPTSLGTAKLSPTRDKVEIDNNIFKIEAHKDKTFVQSYTTYKVNKAELLKFTQDVEILGGVEIILADYNFSIAPKKDPKPKA